MDCSYAGGLSWADQWDSTPDSPLPPTTDDRKKGKDGSKGARSASARFKKMKNGTFGWFKELCQKKSNK